MAAQPRPVLAGALFLVLLAASVAVFVFLRPSPTARYAVEEGGARVLVEVRLPEGRPAPETVQVELQPGHPLVAHKLP